MLVERRGFLRRSGYREQSRERGGAHEGTLGNTLLGRGNRLTNNDPASSGVSDNVLIGTNNEVSDATGSAAVGTANIIRPATGGPAVVGGYAFGGNNVIEGGNSAALGTGNTLASAAIFGTAVGAHNNVSGYGSAAIGANNIVSGRFATAVGVLSESSGDNAMAMGNSAKATADDGVAIGTAAQSSHAGSVALGAGSVADGATLANDAYSSTGDVNDLAGIAPVGEVAVGSAGAERRITKVAAGSADTDAANVSQLKALSEQVNETVGELADTPLTFGGNSGSIARKLGETMNIVGGGTTTGAYAGGNLRTEVDANGDLQLLMAEAPRFGDLVINADGTGRITGVTAGVNDTDAVNVSQLAEVAQSANAGWNISAQGESETKVAPGEAVDLSNTDGNIVVAKTADSNDVTFDLADDLVIGNSITVGGAYIDGTGLTIAGGPSVTAAGIDGGGMLISNVGAGDIGAASLEAVNGSQLWTTANSIAAHLGGAAYGVTVNTDGTLTAPAYQIAAIGSDGSVAATTHNNVGDALGGLSESVTNVNTQIANLGDQIGGLQNDALLWDDAKGAYSANHGGTEPNKITDVAAGELSETSTDAVNGSQLHATNQRVDQIDNRLTTVEGDITTIKGDITNLDNRVTNIEEGVAAVTDRAVVYDGAVGSPKDRITLAGQTSTDGGVTGGTTISNLSQGELSATSTDAVNGAQLHATNQAIETLNDNAVQYSLDANGNKTNKVALLGGDPNAPVLISNVAAGVADTDAANVGQLNEGLRVTLNEAKSYTDSVAINTLNQANQYTDLRFGELNRDIADVRDEARAAAALGLAAGSLRYDDRPGKVSVAVGVGSWRDKGALAWGVGYTSENQGVRANVSASMADGSVGVGAGLSLTLN